VTKRLPYSDVPAFLRALRNTDTADVTKDALEWLILTATRTNETVRRRALSEVERGKTATWTVPPERHDVEQGAPRAPLGSSPLKSSPRAGNSTAARGDFLFESNPGQPAEHHGDVRGNAPPANPRPFHMGFRYSFSRLGR